jgi:hypothetical protein
MNKLVLTTAAVSLTLAATFNLEAASYSRSYGDTWGQATTITTGRSVTNNEIVERAFSTDVGTGGLGGTRNCSGGDCSPADNVASFTEVSVIKTNILVDEFTESNSTSSTQGCFSSIDMNGLAASEGWNISDSDYAAFVTTNVSGNVSGVTKTWTESGNGGAEYGTVFKKDTFNTDIKESNATKAYGGSHVVTFTSSIGYN